jgi:hypothetical protein
MRFLPLILAVAVAASSQQPKATVFIPTSEVVRIATMAARDEGYNPYAKGMFLDELRTAEGQEPQPGYASIALYSGAHPIRSYSIRNETGDVVDPNDCKIFRFPDLVQYGRSVRYGNHRKPVSIATIATEVGCETLKVVSKPVHK